jgi:hypothetical protein
VVTPGSVGDWMQASVMAAALAGLAATCGRALREEDGMRLQGGRDRHGHPAAWPMPQRSWRT